MHFISLILSGGNRGDMSTVRGSCAFAPYCFGDGE
jgi:hypothetical protein